MRAIYEHIEATSQLSWKLYVRQASHFRFAWHFHREFELTLITRGTGTRFVGDCVEEYGPGDLTLIGPQMPHTYQSMPGHGRHEAIVAQFRRDFLGRDFFDRPEFAGVASLLERSARGLSFPPHAVDLGAFGAMPPPERTLALIDALVRLSRCAEARPLAGDQHIPVLNGSTRDRIDAIVRLLNEEYAGPVTLEAVARAAHLAPASASRFFRRTTGTTITGYLNMLRVDAACRLLRETDRSISGIAADCGYSNLSNFNRRFRELKGMSPREYRSRWQNRKSD
ncbi:AraC family transcriptional regulator [Nonomuraea sp. CA-141351]|uniref:AraC family transcriptional regulator n=1 Tax=Nonomuraea sp. CA-141351 TaxID=3239996 RepID=UPI003D8C676E